MCGIAGFWQRRVDNQQLELNLGRMTAAISHRGPDGSGAWCDPVTGIAVGHRRLSIIDLSEAGAQPMISSCGRYVISYNGEVYNAEDLRLELQASGCGFRGHSDTEVIIEGFSAWGIEQTVRQLIGMFAMAVWDRKERSLYLIRDRLGIKPLYWASFGDLLLFGSELKAMRAHPNWSAELDRDALTTFLRFAYVPMPHTIYRGVNKLPPGTILTARIGKQPEIRPYWQIENVIQESIASRIESPREAVDQLEELLGDAVKRRMVADVPLGAFLSGGVDSSVVVALMQKFSSRQVRSFSIGFSEAGYNEAHHAAAVASHLGTDHTELYISSKHALEVVPRLPMIYDEPFADASQIPTFLISKLTQQHVTVALSGDGGDELFGGYQRYFSMLGAEKIWMLPAPLRRAAAAALRQVSPEAWTSLSALVPRDLRPNSLGRKVHKLAQAMEKDRNHFYRSAVSMWLDPQKVVIGAKEPLTRFDMPATSALLSERIEQMQALDIETYLTDDILTKVDRASMAVSLEVRVPILDHRLVALAWRMSPTLKLRNGVGKWALRQVLYRHVPRELVERPKMGFSVPIGAWLRGPLKDWAESLLDPRALAQEGIFNPAPITQLWQAHQRGQNDWSTQLWTVLNFQAWQRQWL